MELLHFYPIDEFQKFRGVAFEVIGECDFYILETRSINSSHKAFQVPSDSLELKAAKSREKNEFPKWQWWGEGNVICGGKEME